MTEPVDLDALERWAAGMGAYGPFQAVLALIARVRELELRLKELHELAEEAQP